MYYYLRQALLYIVVLEVKFLNLVSYPEHIDHYHIRAWNKSSQESFPQKYVLQGIFQYQGLSIPLNLHSALEPLQRP